MQTSMPYQDNEVSPSELTTVSVQLLVESSESFFHRSYLRLQVQSYILVSVASANQHALALTQKSTPTAIMKSILPKVEINLLPFCRVLIAK